jgi:hypothetical protein
MIKGVRYEKRIAEGKGTLGNLGVDEWTISELIVGK